MPITQEELSNLTLAASEKEWNAACDAIKCARGGQYPPDWYAKVVLSGLAAIVRANW